MQIKINNRLRRVAEAIADTGAGVGAYICLFVVNVWLL